MSRIKNWLAEYEEVRQDWADGDQEDAETAEQYGMALEDLAHTAHTLIGEIEHSWPGEILP